MTAPSKHALAPVLAGIIGQPRAVNLLSASIGAPLHAYLFVGPHGTGKREAATAFAAALVCPDGGCGDCPTCRDALAGRHPDIVIVEREGASISVDEARAISLAAQRSPSVARRQVLVLVDFHLVEKAAPALLKTIEEPPSSTVFVILADALPTSLITISSRCAQVEFGVLETTSIEMALVNEGIAPEVAISAATASGGRLDRARLLAHDPGFAERQQRWRSVPERLDGTGTVVSELAGELLRGSEELIAVLQTMQESELAAAVAASERAGERRLPGRAAMEARHRRERRRVRTDDLVAGFASLAEAYRSRLELANTPPRRMAILARACGSIDEAAKSLVRNPNERLLIEALLLRLDAAG